MIKTIKTPNIVKRALLIYSLKDTKLPILRFNDGELEDIL
jgi:hypothetical protein